MPHVPASPCSATHPGCPNLRPCPDHPNTTPWTRTNKRSQLSGSAQQTRARHVIDRDHGICHVCHQPGANEADHVTPRSEGGADDATNMAPIHSTPCHETKTKAEAARARARARATR